jgi:protein ImuB
MAPPPTPTLHHPLWLCLHLPELMLDALGPWPPGVPLPALVWQAERGGRLVSAANAAARALGVTPGQRLSSAQALAPQALVLARDPVREAAHLHGLALALGEITPALVIEPPDVLLEVHASLRLFGGLRPLLRRAETLAGAQGQVRLGLAATPLAAQLLARQRRRRCVQLASTRRRLDGVALAALAQVAALPAAPLTLLQSLGARTLADLARLPRAGLHRRGVGEWLAALDRARGDRPDPKPWFTPPEAFNARLELPWRAEDSAALEAAAAPLLAQLCGWLTLRWQAAQRLQWHLKHEHGVRRHLPDQVLDLELATPSRDAAHLALVLRERLQRMPLAAPVDALTLTLIASVPTAGQALSLLPDDPHTQGLDLALLVDRLRARLGPERVLQLVPYADARPEKADRLQPADVHHHAHPTPHDPPRLPMTLPRPGWLLARPEALAVQHDQPQHQGQPLHLLGKAERIETGWHDGLLVRRDYHAALMPSGALLWVYREHGGSPDEPPRWFLHGLFA